MDDLRTALQTLTDDQPPNTRRPVEVRGRIRRRARQRAAGVGVLGVVALVGAAALLVPGQDPAREVGPARPGPSWEPRGDLLDGADRAVDAWSSGGTVRAVQVLYAGSPVDVTSGRPSTEHWYAWQATRDGAPRLVVARDADGDGPLAPEVLADQRGGTDDRRAVSVVVTQHDEAGDEAVWPGKPGAVVRDTLFVLPAPGTRSVTRLLDLEPVLGTVDVDADSLPVEPSVWTYDAPTTPVRLAVDGTPAEAELELVAPDGRMALAPPAVPAGWVLISGGNGSASGPQLDVTVQVLVRCTSRGSSLGVSYDTASTSTDAGVPCDGRSSSPFGEMEPVPPVGVTQPGVPEGEYRIGLEPGPGVEQLQVWLAIRESDAAALGLTGVDAG